MDINVASVELFQLILNNLEFKSQHQLMGCCRNFQYILRIYILPQKYGKHISDEIQRYPYLKYVNFCVGGYNNKITDEELRYLTNAKYVNLLGCDKITDEGLRYLTNAKHINLLGCYKITDEGLNAFNHKKLKYLTNAKHVNLNYCDKIS